MAVIPTVLDGTYVATYKAEVIADDPLTPEQDEAFIPQSTVIILSFSADGTVKGMIHRNVGGLTDVQYSTIQCEGEYSLKQNTDLGVYEGTMKLHLLRSGKIYRTQDVYIVRKRADAFLFMLRQSIPPRPDPDMPPPPELVPENVRRRAKAVVHGVFEQVTI